MENTREIVLEGLLTVEKELSFSNKLVSDILDKYYLKHLNFYCKKDGVIYLYATSIKAIGGFAAQYLYNSKTIAGAQIRSSLSVIDDCLCNYFLYDIPIKETLDFTKKNHKTRFKQIIKSGPSFNRNEWFKDGKYETIGKINRIYYTTQHNCGGVFKINDKENNRKQVIISICAGMLFNVIAEPIFSYIYYSLILGNADKAASYITITKWITTSTNALFTTIIAALLYFPLRKQFIKK